MQPCPDNLLVIIEPPNLPDIFWYTDFISDSPAGEMPSIRVIANLLAYLYPFLLKYSSTDKGTATQTHILIGPLAGTRPPIKLLVAPR